MEAGREGKFKGEQGWSRERWEQKKKRNSGVRRAGRSCSRGELQRCGGAQGRGGLLACARRGRAGRQRRGEGLRAGRKKSRPRERPRRERKLSDEGWSLAQGRGELWRTKGSASSRRVEEAERGCCEGRAVGPRRQRRAEGCMRRGCSARKEGGPSRPRRRLHEGRRREEKGSCSAKRELLHEAGVARWRRSEARPEQEERKKGWEWWCSDGEAEREERRARPWRRGGGRREKGEIFGDRHGGRWRSARRPAVVGGGATVARRPARWLERLG